MSPTTTHSPIGDVMCRDTPPPEPVIEPVIEPLFPPPLFPPRDADAEARRAWLVSSPWPEVVFASAG